MPNIIIHIGFPKTATTTLQTILRNHTGCDYLGKGLREDLRPSLSVDLASAVFFANTRHFTAQRDQLAARIAERAEKTPCLILSDEAFAFAEHMYITQQWQRQTISDHDVVAGRLAALCPDARILMSLRAQPSFVKSIYKQGVKRGHVTEPFNNYVSREIRALPHRSMLHVLRYDHCYDAYTRCFGKDSVYVNLFEDAKADFAGYLRAIAQTGRLDAEALITEWRGAHENTDTPRKERESVKRLRKLIPNSITSHLPSGFKKRVLEALAKPAPEVLFSEEQLETITRYFAQPNADLAKMAALDLAGKGYPLP